MAVLTALLSPKIKLAMRVLAPLNAKRQSGVNGALAQLNAVAVPALDLVKSPRRLLMAELTAVPRLRRKRAMRVLAQLNV